MKFDIVGFVYHAAWPRYARPNPLFSLNMGMLNWGKILSTYLLNQWESIFRCRWPREHFKTKLLATVQEIQKTRRFRKQLTLRSKTFQGVHFVKFCETFLVL